MKLCKKSSKELGKKVCKESSKELGKRQYRKSNKELGKCECTKVPWNYSSVYARKVARN